jgi:hypothetical protein
MTTFGQKGVVETERKPQAAPKPPAGKPMSSLLKAHIAAASAVTIAVLLFVLLPDRPQTPEQIAASQARDAQARAESDAQALESACDRSIEAFVMSQEFVRRKLASPSTASFPYINDRDVSVLRTDTCLFTVVAYVDAQNGFGATTRSRYVANMKFNNDDKGSWSLAGMNLD